MLIEPGSKLVMIGDSITDFDRARPVGEGLRDALGKSYVMLVDAMLKAIAPRIGSGWSIWEPAETPRGICSPAGGRICWISSRIG